MRRTLLAAALVLALPALSAPPKGAHWKSEMTGSALPAPVSVETWVKGASLRAESRTAVGTSTVIVRDGTAWVTTGSLALRMPAAQHRSATPQPADYVLDLDGLLASATRLGTESLDGEECETWKVTQTRDGRTVESVLWLSPSLRFPRQVEAKTDRGAVRIRNREIDVKGPVDDAHFAPDAKVAWQDLGDVVRQLQATPAPRGTAAPAAKAPAATPAPAPAP